MFASESEGLRDLRENQHVFFFIPEKRVWRVLSYCKSTWKGCVGRECFPIAVSVNISGYNLCLGSEGTERVWPTHEMDTPEPTTFASGIESLILKPLSCNIVFHDWDWRSSVWTLDQLFRLQHFNQKLILHLTYFSLGCLLK